VQAHRLLWHAAAMALADMERRQDADRRELESRRALAYWW
jgi:hypothetical protein